MKKDNIQIVPPTKKQVQDVLFYLRNGTFLENACVLAGVPIRLVTRWMQLGRKNVPGFVEFTNAIDRSNAELGDKLSKAILTAAEDGDLAALKWLYEKRLGQREKHVQAKWLQYEDESFEELAQSDEVIPLEDAEKQLEELLMGSEGELQ